VGYQIERMTPHEAVEARRGHPVAYLPLGILEWHGPHLPLGYDGLKAHALCRVFAEQIGGVALPPLWYGDNRNEVAEVHFNPERMSVMPRDMRDDIAHALGVDKDGFERVAARSIQQGEWRLFHEVLEQTLWQIEALGFKAMLVLCGHYPLSWAAAPVVERFNREHQARVVAATEAELVHESGDHAALWETSLGLALLGELVSMDRLPAPPGELIGILGPDARGATAEYGRDALDRIVRAARQTVESLLAP
jgi:creatinine amidohydrolase